MDETVKCHIVFCSFMVYGCKVFVLETQRFQMTRDLKPLYSMFMELGAQGLTKFSVT